MGAPFDCSDPVKNGPSPKSTMWTYYGCTDGIASCYAPNAPSTCCGCVNWWTVGVPVPQASTNPCVNINQEWVGDMEPKLVWLKAACPTCYVYVLSCTPSTMLRESLSRGSVRVSQWLWGPSG